MVDKSSNGGSGRSDLDPFAELTRIMGFDPREPVTREPEVGPEPDIAATSAEAKPEPSLEANAQDKFDADLERELDGEFDEPSLDVAADEFDQPIADLDAIEADIGLHVDDFLAEPEAIVAAGAEEMASVELAAAEEIAAADLSEEDLADDWEPAPFLGAHPVEDIEATIKGSDDLELADLDMDLDSDASASEFDGATIDRVSEAALEAEYNALLGNAADMPSASVEAAPPIASEAERRTAAIVTAGWRRQAEPAFSAAGNDTPAPRSGIPAAPESIDDDLVAALAHAEIEEVSVAQQPAAPTAASASIVDDPFAALAAMAAKYQNSNPEAAWRSTTPRQEPAFAPQARTEPTVARTNVAAEQAYAPAYAAPVAPRAAARTIAPVPEIETVDVRDAASYADDFNVPDFTYDEQPPSSFEDIDIEFNNLLSEMSTGERREPAAPNEVHAEPIYAPQRIEPVYSPAQRYPAYVEQRTAAARPAEPAKPSYYDDEDDAYEAADDSFDEGLAAYDPNNEDFGNVQAADAQQRNPRRGLLIAAIVGGLALIGGISAVAMSFGSSGENGEIALIKADAKPVKVRPENPGGSTVPNQESGVYDAVSRSASNAAPSQVRLVNNSEEPIDLPTPDDEMIEEIDSVAKAEDRVNATEETDVAEAQDPIAVEPRKVRTMVVKPDGSLAPREEPAPATTESIEATPEASAESQPENITTGATQPASPVTEETVAAIPAPAGAWSVQVSSQPSEDSANKSLQDIKRKYGGVIGGRGANIVKAEVAGKGTFYRVRIAAASREEAVNLCGDLKSAGGSCFVTK